MIREKIVYVTEDGSEFSTKSAAEKHMRLKKFKKDLSIILRGKDLTSDKEDFLFHFIVDNLEELGSMLFDLNNEDVCSFKEI